MLFVSSLLLAALVGVSRAQTPEGFTPSVETKLDVMFNGTVLNTPGQQLTKAGTASQPQIAVADANTEDTFMFVMIDLDVPPAEGSTERRTLLHAMATGFRVTQQQTTGTGANLLVSSDQGPATYIGPSPPATDTVPHRYVELLFQQPENLQVQAADFANTQDRINFDIEAFIQENELSEPIAANFFTVNGRASGSATGTATSSGGISRNTLQPFEGAAVRKEMPLGLAGLLGSLAFFAM
ncbi:PEBP-like protein [Zopfia rhizophila CBS 207.26]|uniref:PEBP-like protein n=1 Tax=Zopfia rhizophila CBS 207.26 TaxID=1314779 RepID=A0A6A6EPW1_9PEZI|nr:PEBP-like protein [Zopfia rhizophila CBS 207.26]